MQYIYDGNCVSAIQVAGGEVLILQPHGVINIPAPLPYMNRLLARSLLHGVDVQTVTTLATIEDAHIDANGFVLVGALSAALTDTQALAIYKNGVLTALDYQLQTQNGMHFYTVNVPAADNTYAGDYTVQVTDGTLLGTMSAVFTVPTYTPTESNMMTVTGHSYSSDNASVIVAGTFSQAMAAGDALYALASDSAAVPNDVAGTFAVDGLSWTYTAPTAPNYMHFVFGVTGMSAYTDPYTVCTTQVTLSSLSADMIVQGTLDAIVADTRLTVSIYKNGVEVATNDVVAPNLTFAVRLTDLVAGDVITAAVAGQYSTAGRLSAAMTYTG